MRIRSLEIRGFQGLRHFEMNDVPQLVVLVGPNGSGKTSVLQALGLLKDWVGTYGNSRTSGGYFVNAASDLASIRAEFGLSPKEKELLGTSENVLSATLEIRNQRLVERRPSEPLRELFETYRPEEGLGVVEHFSAHRGRGGERTERVEVELDRPRRERSPGTPVFGGRDDFSSVFNSLAGLVLGDWLHRRETGQDRNSLKPYQDLFRRLFAPKAFLGLESSDDGRIEAVVETADGKHRLGRMSSGEREAFMVLAWLLQKRLQDSIILYDTPEQHLNGKIERLLYSELLPHLERGNQFILATHSYEMIESAPTEAVYRVEPYMGRNQVRAISEEQEKIEVFEALGASVGVQLISECVAFLEGEGARSDIDLIRKIFPDLPTSTSLVPTGGVATTLGVAQRCLDLMVEGTRHCRFYAIRDRDYLTPQERDAQMARNSHLLILERYHIENYLLSAAAISEATERIGKHMSPAEIESLLEAVAQDMREKAASDWVRFRLNTILQQDLVKSAPPDRVASMKGSAASKLKAVQGAFDPHAVDQLLQSRLNEVDAQWKDGMWRTEFPGRDLLAGFVNRSQVDLGLKPFRHLVASCLRTSDADATSELRKAVAPIFG